METKQKILVIDDDKWIRTFLASVLESSGYVIVQAEDPMSALNVAIMEKPDLILLDIFLPVINGDVLIQFIKAIELIRDIPIVILSGHLDGSIVAKTYKFGAVGFISKPFTKETVMEKINEAFGIVHFDETSTIY